MTCPKCIEGFIYHEICLDSKKLDKVCVNCGWREVPDTILYKPGMEAKRKTCYGRKYGNKI
mgnify:CR=1 FL=1